MILQSHSLFLLLTGEPCQPGILIWPNIISKPGLQQNHHYYFSMVISDWHLSFRLITRRNALTIIQRSNVGYVHSAVMKTKPPEPSVYCVIIPENNFRNYEYAFSPGGYHQGHYYFSALLVVSRRPSNTNQLISPTQKQSFLL